MRRTIAAVMLWWLMVGFGSTMKVSPLHPEPFATAQACYAWASHSPINLGPWHCEEGP